MARRVAMPAPSAPVPEADCVEGFAHPRELERLIGHDGPSRELADAFVGGKIHHGWLLCGPSGIGKASLAYRFAKFVLADQSERVDEAGGLGVAPDGRASRQVMARSHPGLLVIRRPFDTKTKRFVTTIPVDEVRRIRNFLTLSGGEGAWRVVIIDTADEMNVNAANAVLKSLEEPPVRTLFLLISSEPGRLLPTIRSRCRTLQLAPLGMGDLDTACRNAFGAAGVNLPPDKDWARLLELGGGSVGRVVALSGMGGVEVIMDVERMLGQAGKPDWRAIHVLGDKLAPVANLARFELFFDLLLEHLAKIISGRASGEGSGDVVALGNRLIVQERISDWAALWENISRSKADVEALNLDRKAFVVETAQRLHELARGVRA